MELFLRMRLPVFISGLTLFVVNERYLASENYHLYLKIAAGMLLLAAALLPLFVSFSKQKKGLGEEARSWRLVFYWQMLVVISIACYLGYEKLMGMAASPDSIGAKALLAGWLLSMIFGLASGIGIEFAHRSSGTGALAEPKRVLRGGMSCLLVGIFFSFLVCVNYIANKKDKAFDWSYLKTTAPGESTVNTVKALKNPLTVNIFYPADNEVLGHVKEYFGFLADKTKNLKIEFYDTDLNPTKAEELKVSQNGQVIFTDGDKKERLDIGLKLRSAAGTLKKLDAEVQKTVLRLTESKKTLYFTRGHGELSWSGGERSPLLSLSLMERFLRSQNYTLKAFGVPDGSTTDVPEDAGAVIIVGPDMPFMKEEADALQRYLDKGGKIFALLDIGKASLKAPEISKEGTDPMLSLLASTGIKFEKKLLANDKNFVTATRSPSDHWFIFSNSFTSHESVTSLSKHDERIALILFQSGHLQITPKEGDWKATATIRALSDTFIDDNKNFKFDAGKEKREGYTLGAAATNDKDAKVLVIADSNIISEALIRNPANALFFGDGLKWLTGTMDTAGEIASEEDVKIQHTRKEDVLWFNGTVVGVPALVLLAGFFATRRRKSKKA
jgi:hypothetical protein